MHARGNLANVSRTTAMSHVCSYYYYVHALVARCVNATRVVFARIKSRGHAACVLLIAQKSAAMYADVRLHARNRSEAINLLGACAHTRSV